MQTKRSKHPMDVGAWILKCIQSMNNHEQFMPLHNLIRLYKKQYGFAEDSAKFFSILFMGHDLEKALFKKVKELK